MKLGKWCVGGMRLLLWTAIAFAQDPEAARLERNGDQAVLTADSRRPVDSVAKTLAKEFGIRVNVEDPPYVFSGDIAELTVGVPRPVRVPKGGRLEVRFALGPSGRPADVPGLVKAIADVANAQFPFAYRIDADGDWFTLVPTRTRDLLGQTISIIPLLDRRVTIRAGTRQIMASAALMTDALSAQTGLRVSCCQGVVGGIPWGIKNIPFEASDEPARNVLKRLIVAASGGRPSWEYWLERCGPMPSTFCFINLLPAAIR
jgi:hypothetical protein